MKENSLDLDRFHVLTNEKWVNEPLEFFKCNNCDLIVIGLPDCHLALIDPENLNKKIDYNLPKKVHCPNCNIVWYDFQEDKKYKVINITPEELLASNWGEIFDRK
jgi:hypothetical protein